MTSQLTTAEPTRHEQPTVKVKGLTHLIFERPDVKLAQRFLHDFGLISVPSNSEDHFLKGADSRPYCYILRPGPSARFIGLGFQVDSRDDLHTLSSLPGASLITKSQRPGGGDMIQLVDPSGFLVEILYGQTDATEPPSRSPLPINSPQETRRIDSFQRPPHSSPEVIRLGHVVLEVADFQATCCWYTKHLGLIPSDVQVLPDGSPAVAFLRLNQGDIPTDHHTLALAQGFMATYSHSAYEVVDTDAVGMGQRILRDRGWKHAWGMGRHILGSQVFDYWQDPWGSKHEHYCDGDLLTSRMRTGVHSVSRDAMSQWGPLMPTSFTRPKVTLNGIAALVRNLRKSPDLTIRKLVSLAKIFS